MQQMGIVFPAQWAISGSGRTPGRWSVIAALVLLAASRAASAEDPVKLAVEPQWYGMRAGESVPIRVRLLNAANQPATSPKKLEITLQARLASGEVKPLRTVEFQPGDSTKEVTITPPGSGAVYIWAKQGEMLPGGAFVAVRPGTRKSQAGDTRISKAGPDRKKLENILRPPQASSPAAPPPGAGPVPIQVAPQAPGRQRLALSYSPDRRFLADGKDAVTIQAFLLSEPASADIRLNLFDSSGAMRPVPLVIPKGEDMGRASLTFNQPGKVQVEFLSSVPPMVVEGNSKLEIPFMPPITHLALEASPPTISLVDKADLIVSLLDDEGRPVATDTARHVVFAIEGGRGELAQKEIDIAPGQFQARTSFQPAWLGRVRITAATSNLWTAAAPVQIFTPGFLLGCSIAGALAGGYFSYLKRKKSGRRRIGIGLVTGFIFYWGCLFIGLATISHAVAVNPASAFALSAFGGWMQTDVFKFWKSWLK